MATPRALLGLGLFLFGCQNPGGETGTGDTDATTSTSTVPGTESGSQTGASASETSAPTSSTSTSEDPTPTSGEVSTTLVSTTVDTSTTFASTTDDTSTTEPGTTGTMMGCDEPVVFEGTLTITEATDLAGLECIVEITGDLHVQHTLTLASFAELGNLKLVGGLIVFESNALLPNLDGLKSLERAQGLILINNPQLTSFDGLESLTQLGNLKLESNHALTNVKALTNLEILESLEVGVCGGDGNDALVDLQGLENLTALDSVTFDSNDGLKSIDALPHDIGLTWLAAHNNPQLPAAMLEAYLAETMLDPEDQLCGNADMPPPGLCGCTIPP